MEHFVMLHTEKICRCHVPGRKTEEQSNSLGWTGKLRFAEQAEKSADENCGVWPWQSLLSVVLMQLFAKI